MGTLRASIEGLLLTVEFDDEAEMPETVREALLHVAETMHKEQAASSDEVTGFGMGGLDLGSMRGAGPISPSTDSFSCWGFGKGHCTWFDSEGDLIDLTSCRIYK